MTFKNIRIERVEGHVAILKVARPEALNSLNAETLRELQAGLKDLAGDSDVRAVVFTGEGEKAFIAGADILEMKEMNHVQAEEFSRLGHGVTRLLENMPKPVIAAVNGFALGGGTEMAIACDFILASDRAVFGQPEVGLGIFPGFGATARLAKFVGLPMAKELVFSGRRVRSDEALTIGLANRVYPSAELMNKAVELARTISMQSPSAVASAKRLMNDASESVEMDGKLSSEAKAFGELFGSHDQREGMGAFVEKRKPAFQASK